MQLEWRQRPQNALAYDLFVVVPTRRNWVLTVASTPNVPDRTWEMCYRHPAAAWRRLDGVTNADEAKALAVMLYRMEQAAYPYKGEHR